VRAIKAETFTGYGGLRQVELPKPQAAKDRVLVHVTAAGVTPLDHTILSGGHPRAPLRAMPRSNQRHTTARKDRVEDRVASQGALARSSVQMGWQSWRPLSIRPPPNEWPVHRSSGPGVIPRGRTSFSVRRAPFAPHAPHCTHCLVPAIV
jgi:hypothetical protein